MKLRLVAGAMLLVACSSGSKTVSDSKTGSETNSASAPSVPFTKAEGSTTSESASTEAPETSTTAAPPTLVTINDLVSSPRPIVLAHAGGEDQHPHSTPYAFAESVKAGVDMLDFDVQLSKDGVLVIHHDDTVERTTNGAGNVADLTYAELSALDNAYWFATDCTCGGLPPELYLLRGMRTGEATPLNGATAEDFIIPRFRDIVAKYPTMPLNIEIKGTGETAIAAAQALADVLSEFDALERSVVSSFDDTVVAAFHEMAPTVEISPGLTAATAWILENTPLPLDIRVLQLPPEFQGIKVLTPETISRSHAAGYVIWVWPNDRSRWENLQGYAELLAMGMDGLNINFPRDGVAAVREFAQG